MFGISRVLFITATLGWLTSTAVYAASTADQQLTDECGACHMVFPPKMLPTLSWVKIMAGLSDHFGENAALDDTTARQIEAILVVKSSKTGFFGGDKYSRGLAANDVPLRITETPYWIRKHKGEVPDSAWTNPKVKYKSNCIACHRGAASGNFDDD